MNSAAEVRWHFTGAVAPERVLRLLSWEGFDDIIERLSTCEIAPLYWEDAIAPRLQGCRRASFALRVESDDYDGFFNSPVGYRGQFANSERQGEIANRKLLDALFPRLLQIAAGHSTANRDFVVTSLRGKQAKVWIDELEVEDQISDPNPHIVFPLWDFNEPNGPGLRAPSGVRLEVKGGWVSATGDEVINAAKEQRSHHINSTGESK